MDEKKDYAAIRLPPDTEEEGRYVRSLLQKNDIILDNKINTNSNVDIENAPSDRKKNYGGWIKSIAKKIMTWFAWSLFSLYILSKLVHLIFPIFWSPAECLISLDYDRSKFPGSNAQLHLDSSIEFLADRYGKDILGQNCRSPSRRLYFEDASASESQSAWIKPTAAPQHFSQPPFPSERYIAEYSLKEAPPVSVAPSEASLSFQNGKYYSSIPPSSAFPEPTKIAFSNTPVEPANGGTRKILPYMMDDNTRLLSVDAANLYSFSVNSLDGLEVVTEIMTESQAQQNNSGRINIYLKPYDKGAPYDHYFERLVDFSMIASGRRAVITVEHNDNRHNHAYRSDIKCKLLIVVPDKGHVFERIQTAHEMANGTVTYGTSYLRGRSNIQRFSIVAQKGRVTGRHLSFNNLDIKIGRGAVFLTNVDVHKLTTAILYGDAILEGITVRKSIASGVIRGSSTVLAKIHPDTPRGAYDVINMSADGYTYTDVMTTQENREQFAADFYIYRKTGTLPPHQRPLAIVPPETTYTYSEPDLAHVDETSTDIFKTGYLIHKNSGSHISVYSDAKNSKSFTQKSRFLYGYYY